MTSTALRGMNRDDLSIRLIAELAEELEGELHGRFAGMLDHPAMKRRFDRDMMTVVRARRFLEQGEGADSGGC